VVWFALGRRHGRRILQRICGISLSPESCVRQTEGLFHRYGLYSVAAAKFIPGFSTVAPPLAGAMGVRLVPFVAATSAGALLWAGASMAIGWIFHDTLERLADWLESLGSGALLVLAVLLFGFIAFKVWKRRRFQRLLQMARISPSDLKSLLEGSRDTMIFDVRTDSGRRHDPRRIPGAIVLNAEDSHELDASLAALPKDRDIVLYCT
jgi:hypothetical protein